jgi:hypothetical protein
MRRLLPLCALALALALPAPASAIVNGEAAAQGEFPAQAFIAVNDDLMGSPERICGGTLVGSRQVLTSARCVTTPFLGTPSAVATLSVRLGDADLTQTPADVYVVAENDRHAGYNATTGVNDIAMLTLDRPAPGSLVPERVVDLVETQAWTPGTSALVLGWGEITPGGNPTAQLRTGSVAIHDDDDCPGGSFNATVMLCASAPSAGNPCASDTGSPLLVPDGSDHALAGVFSGLGAAGLCSSASQPAVFARVGAEPLNKWVHDRTPEADFSLSHQPRANEPVTLTSTSRYPPPGLAGDDFFDTIKWDLDADGEFDDKVGKQFSHTFTREGTAIVGIEASNAAAGDSASAYFGFAVEADPNPPQQPPGSSGPAPTKPPTTTRVPGPLATILVSGRPKVRNRRFAIRVRFAAAAPRGTAVIEVYRGTRRIGIGRTKVARGATKRVRVKLTPQGRRLLRRAETRRLKIRVRVRVGREILRTKRLTIRR